VIDIVTHKNVRVSDVSDNLDSGISYQIFFHIMDRVRTRDIWNKVEKFINRERFRSRISELISPRIQIDSGEEAENAIQHFTVSVA